MIILALRCFAVFVSLVLLAGWITSESLADPATPRSERVAKYGSWSVVKKPSTYVIVNDAGEPVKQGRRFLCSAVLFASNASLEFQATNDEAWSIFVAADGWNYRYAIEALTIRSASKEIRIGQAVYHGPMISAASHYMGGGKPVPSGKLRSLFASGQPISIHSNTGRKLITFPNSGNDLAKAFNQAIDCTLAESS